MTLSRNVRRFENIGVFLQTNRNVTAAMFSLYKIMIVLLCSIKISLFANSVNSSLFPCVFEARNLRVVIARQN